MKRADGYSTIVCNGCGTIPIFNERQGLTICSMCDGPVKYIGATATNLEILPPLKRSVATFSRIDIPYAYKVLDQEMNAYLNMGMRVLTEADVKHFRGPPIGEIAADEEERLLTSILPERVLLETEVPKMIIPEEQPEVRPEDLAALGLTKEEEEEKEKVAQEVVVPPVTAQNNVNIQLPAGMTVAQQPPVEQEEVDTLLQQADEEIPYSSEAPMSLQQPGRQQNLQGGGGNSSNGTGVNVQTTSQPVLVIPMNIGQSAPTEIIRSPIAGAPSTIAVDTSEKALNSLGLPPQNQRPANRGISPNARRPSSNASGGGSKSGAPVVTVQRQGASSSPSSINSNVRINVTKQN